MIGSGGAFVGVLAREAALAMALAVPALAQEPAKWGAWLDIEGKLGTRRNLGEADLFVPLAQDGRTLLFGDARFRLDDQDSREGNLGLGVRRMVEGWNLGGYGYYDRRRSEYGNTFNQATFGVEALGRDFDARANGYLPFGTRIRPVDALNTAELSGAAIQVRGGEERALPGFDAEVGWRMPAFDAEGPYDFRLYGGGFRFDDPAAEAVAGPRLRAEFTAYEVPHLWEGARLTLGAEWQTDEVRGGQGFVSARLRIPLQPEKQRSRQLTAQERRMTAPTVRDVDVVAQAGTFGAPETATQTATGSAITVISSATTSGAGLPAAVAGAGNGSTVILSGSFATTATTTLQTGQTVMGAGSLAVRSPSGRTATLTTPTATVAGAVTGVDLDTFRMATNSTLTGLTISNTHNADSVIGVMVQGVDGATVADNTITATETGAANALAVRIINGTNVTIRGNTLTANSNPGGDAYAISMSSFGGNTSATVTGNTLGAAGGDLNWHTYLSHGGGAVTLAILPGSSGNVISSGTCNGTGVNSGSIGYTNGSTCP